jgi:hypothetical protein
MMKRLTRYVLPVLLGIAPVIGTESSHVEHFKDFLSQAGTTYKITRAFEEETSSDKVSMLASVKAELPNESSKSLDIPIEKPLGRFVGTGWEHNKKEHFSQRKGKVFVTIFQDGSSVGETEAFLYTKQEEISHKATEKEGRFLGEIALKDSDSLPVGKS